MNFTSDFALAIIPALLIHLLLIFITELLPIFPIIDYEIIGNIIIGAAPNESTSHTLPNLNEYKYLILLYIISSLFISSLLGYSVRELIRSTKLDRKYRFFRFNNQWHYLLSGECLDFPDVPDNYEDINVKLIDILCEIDDEAYIYKGNLFDYTIDSNRDLNNIQLQFTIRKKLNSTEPALEHSLQSRYFLIPKENIININFLYFNVGTYEGDFPNLEEREFQEIAE